MLNHQSEMMFHPFFTIAFLLMLGIPAALLALLIAWAVQRQPAHTPTPLEILDRRFASGELSAEEYQKARDLLQGKS